MLFDKLPVTLNVPALIVVAPVYVLAFERTTVPAPVFVIPYPPLITPDNVNVSPAFVAIKVLSAVNVMLPAKLLVTSLSVPPAKVIASAPTVTLCRSKVAPLATLVPPEVAPKPLLFVTRTVPALMVVAPE